MTNAAVVVGGGVIGLTTALELRRRGLDVTLLERDRVGASASSAAGGILSPLQPWRCEPALAGLWALSLSRYRTLFDELRDEEPENAVEPTTPGLLCLIAREAPAARAWIETQAQGQRLIELDADALAREEPALDADAGFLLPDVRRIDPPALLGALTRAAARRGVRIREHCAVREIKMKGGGGKAQTKGVETDAGFVAADVVVVCAGAWLSALLPEAFARPQVRPVRGQIIKYAAEPGLLRHVVSHQAPASSQTPGAEMENYLIPCADGPSDGHILAGSTLEDCGFDDSVTDTARDALALAAERVLPTLARCPVVRQWAGLRPDAGRKTPVICAHPQIAGLFVNGGHYRNGIALAAGSALLAAQLVCEEETAMDAKPLSFGGGFGGGFAS